MRACCLTGRSGCVWGGRETGVQRDGNADGRSRDGWRPSGSRAKPFDWAVHPYLRRGQRAGRALLHQTAAPVCLQPTYGEDASAVVKTMADETKAKFHKYVFLRNEPTDFEMKNRGYPAGRQEVMEEKSPEKRWVRFLKRTHRRGVFEAR